MIAGLRREEEEARRALKCVPEVRFRDRNLSKRALRVGRRVDDEEEVGEEGGEGGMSMLGTAGRVRSRARARAAE